MFASNISWRKHTGTAVTEHSCIPNCSFTTHSNTLYMTAIRDISEGDRISIDYGNNFYHPTADRVESLCESYRFICKCPECLGPDRKRSFVCGKCNIGTVCPVGTGLTPDSDVSFSPCQSCGNAPEISYRQLCLSKEMQYKTDPPVTAAQIDHVSSVEKVLHESHYLIFWARDDNAMLLASKARREGAFTGATGKAAKASVVQSRQSYNDAVTAMEETVRLLEIMLPPVHHEKIVYYDRLGQLAVAAGNYSVADANFRKSYEMSCLACGENTPCTQVIKKLISHPPRSLDELIEHYRQSGQTADVLSGDGDEIDEI